MRQADIQRLRKTLASQITFLHGEKHEMKEVVNHWWLLATPDTASGRDAFINLNNSKKAVRYISSEIAKFSSLIKALKKEERAETNRRMEEFEL